VETLNVWDEMMKAAGKTLQETGKTVTEKSMLLSLKELEDLVGSLRAITSVFEQRIAIIQKEN